MAMMRLRREDPRVVGSFRLHRRLGAGGMGVVYLGSDKRGQRVALKVIRPDLAEDHEFRSRFAREVQAARRIRGGCTARLVAADLDADRPWFATQYVPGPSLHDKVNDEGPLPPAQVATIGAALSEGLLAVHDAGVVHRDLKPSNILLSPKGPRIIDFGIAWATGASTLTHVGTAVGSPGFLAPEQVRGAAVTPATDIFALGATLAYACTADSPFGHGSSEVMLYRVVHEEAQLAGVPEALAPLVAGCLAKDPAERPSTLTLSLRLKEIAAREAHGLSDGPVDGLPGETLLRTERGGPERPGGRRAEDFVRQRADERHTPGHGTGTPRPQSSSRPSVSRPAGSRSAAGTHDGWPPGPGANGGRQAAGSNGRSAPAGSNGRSASPGSNGRSAPAGSNGRSASPGSNGRTAPAGSNGRSASPGSNGRSAGTGSNGRSSGPHSNGRSGGRAPGRVPGARSAGRNGSRPARTTSGGRRPAGPDRRLLRQRLIVFVTVTLLVALGIAAAQGCQGPTRGLGVLGSAHGQGTHAADAHVPGTSRSTSPGTSADADAHP
ncbi:serine/threonine protein kinase [Streptomyces ochraceiscleroticus]|uniref:Protein kinase n=1 Tax=Streptomyces ochraceiscleroticus TaxID=47761 RepID=A0ABW1MQK3_9ACTN|nr:serine/threonine protein kinase [Streptomyces ochraceiscleroticus]